MVDLVKLYDENGERVGTYCIETGRAQIGYNFFVIERACKPECRDSSDGFHSYYCSNCGEFMGIYPKQDNYCYNCGVKLIH